MTLDEVGGGICRQGISRNLDFRLYSILFCTILHCDCSMTAWYDSTYDVIITIFDPSQFHIADVLFATPLPIKDLPLEAFIHVCLLRRFITSLHKRLKVMHDRHH
jgi:hypothetical protein